MYHELLRFTIFTNVKKDVEQPCIAPLTKKNLKLISPNLFASNRKKSLTSCIVINCSFSDNVVVKWNYLHKLGLEFGPQIFQVFLENICHKRWPETKKILCTVRIIVFGVIFFNPGYSPNRIHLSDVIKSDVTLIPLLSPLGLWPG
jgi:hypothetical protein